MQKNNENYMQRADWRFFWAIIEKWGRGIFVEDEKGEVLLANEAFCKIFLPDRKPEDLAGINAMDLTESVSKLVTDKKEFLTWIKKVMAGRERVQDQEIRLTNNRLFQIDCIPVIHDGKFLGRIWEFHEGTTMRDVEEKLLARNQELEKINKIMVGRELRMIELKEEIQKLQGQLKNQESK